MDKPINNTIDDNDNGGNGDGRPTIPGIDPVTRRFLPGNKLYLNANKAPNPATVAMRELKDQLVLMVSPKIIPGLLELIDNDNAKIRLGAIKLAIETLIPKEIIHAMIGRILHEHEEADGPGKLQGLLSALPLFGEYLRYKSAQDRDRIVNADVIDNNDKQADNATSSICGGD